jgi:glycerophosphoryl diester phosphodiesterase
VKDWLIAHRGARCDGRENTIKAFKAASKYPVGWVELDLHATKDKVVVCHHDFDINGLAIASHNFAKLKTADPELATFDEAIKAVGKIPLIVEIKAAGVAKLILDALKQHPSWRVTGYNPSEQLYLLNNGIDSNRLYLSQQSHPLGLLSKIAKNSFGGISINRLHYWPYLYLLARGKHLNVLVYTVNSRLHARLIRKLCPKAGICTDRPDKLARLK